MNLLPTTIAPMGNNATVHKVANPHSASNEDGNLDTTATLIARPVSLLTDGMGTSSLFPHLYVRRQPSDCHIGKGDATLCEYMAGMRSLMKDPAVNNELRVSFDTHLTDILEECGVSKWEDVRSWSEFCFTQIHRGLWSKGWESAAVAQYRMSMATLPAQVIKAQATVLCAPAAAPLSRPMSGPVARPPPQPGTSSGRGRARVAELLNGEELCWPWNRDRCAESDLHMVKGKIRHHLCSFCLNWLGRREVHREVECTSRDHFKGSAQGFPV